MMKIKPNEPPVLRRRTLVTKALLKRTKIPKVLRHRSTSRVRRAVLRSSVSFMA
jgi:hypothetical protein